MDNYQLVFYSWCVDACPIMHASVFLLSILKIVSKFNKILLLSNTDFLSQG